ncbi:MAG TPA: hypothetical protein VNS09_10760 [Solirubrobacter sp.]|nr:hypothetical protein [Solirubrobacter sp.]
MRALPLALLAALLLAAPAAAAPVALGPGSDPSVVVDAAGTAHIAFATAAGQAYCRLPRGARACDVRSDLSQPLAAGDFLEPPALFDRPDGTLLMVIASTERQPVTSLSGRTYYRVSADRGATWSAPVGVAWGNHGFGGIRLTPDGQVVLDVAREGSAVYLQLAPLSGGETRVASLNDHGASVASADVAPLPDGRLLATYGDYANALRWRVFATGDVFDQVSWSPARTLRKVQDPQLVTGPRGTYLFERRSPTYQRTGDYPAPFALRAFDTARTRWRRAREAGADRSVFGPADAAQDARGRVHVAAGTSSGHTSCIVYARTTPKGWFGRTTVLTRTTREPTAVRVAAGPSGRGVVVWADRTDVWALPLRQAKGTYRAKRRQADRPACTGTRF